MATFNFDRVTLDAGTTFIFGSSVCIADGSGGFNSLLANPMSLGTSSPSSHNHFDEAVEDFDEFLLPELVVEIEKMSVSDVTSIRSMTTTVRLDPIYSETHRTLLPLGLRNATAL